MSGWTILFSVLVSVWGTMTFLAVVARSIEGQRAHLELARYRLDEIKRREAISLLVAKPISIDA